MFQYYTRLTCTFETPSRAGAGCPLDGTGGSFQGSTKARDSQMCLSHSNNRPFITHSNYCKRYALHCRTPRARTRYWRRGREGKMCSNRGMANGREDESIDFPQTWELSWSGCWVVVFGYCCVLFCCVGVVFRRIIV